MPCSCGQNPCRCQPSPCSCGQNPCRCRPCPCGQNPCCCPKRTKCDLYKPGEPNVWVERGDTPGSEDAPGICLLDTMTPSQVIYSIERDDVARADLLKVTSDPELRRLAREVVRLPTAELVDMEQTNGNRPKEVAGIPFYGIFRGQPPFAK